MRIAFVQDWRYEQPGIMSIASVLKQHGHHVEVFVDSLEPDVIDALRRMNPGIVCFSCTTPEEPWVLRRAAATKRALRVPIVVGGVHPTMFPQLIDSIAVDIICRGDGEYPLLELVDALESGDDPIHIRNLWVKVSGRVHKNSLRPLLRLDRLPYPDSSVYDKYAMFRQSPFAGFIFSRGCIYECNFCYSHSLRKLYSGKGQYLRTKTADYAINEVISRVLRKKITTVHFYDSIFGVNQGWASEFLRRYRDRVGISFTCNARPELLTVDYVKKLKEAGCRAVTIGVETGDENIRNKILHKQMSDRDLFAAAKLLRKYGIKLLTENMFSLPHETYERALKTVYINKKLKSDYVLSNFLQPSFIIYLKAHKSNTFEECHKSY